MSAILPKISYPIPSDEQGQAFADTDALLAVLAGESSGQYLVGSQGMWHGGIHITDAKAPLVCTEWQHSGGTAVPQ
ncbi:hypothetical protein [Edaphovirga cremea]|uniref:hypothetical protein n=1 Tax=Edaphovirga cremea TaxID=2267246 RepID=UPI000DEF8C6E